MIRNYFRIALRNVIRNKFSSIINIGGLAIGMAVAILIGLWIWDEFSFNKYHKNYDRIGEVMKHANYDDQSGCKSQSPLPIND